MKREISNQKELGSFVHDARIKLGLTQEALADRAGVSRKWLIGLEQGVRTRAEFGKILDTLEALGVSLTLSFGQDVMSDTPKAVPTEQLNLFSPATAAALKKFSSESESPAKKLSSTALSQSSVQRMTKEIGSPAAIARGIEKGLPSSLPHSLESDLRAGGMNESNDNQVPDGQDKQDTQ
ncbi:helix-turn-helix domain-containing protein [Glutamicibacter sp. NPDC087344]|uniref:helix-turn-helix domain-containing protein n=1 Tax=Glutamicibacter sp. NPDC087344 TaxID=3363994 RepID=UPI003820920A